MDIELDAPVRQVTCLEDRAVVTREGQASLGKGTQRVWIRGASPVIADRSLAVEVPGAKVISARVERRWVPPPPRPESPLDEELLGLQRELERIGVEQARLVARQEIEQAAREDVMRAMAEQAAADIGAASEWRAQLSRVREALGRTETALLELNRRREQLEQRIGEVQLARVTEPPRPILETAIAIDVEAASALEATVRARYLVACAAWRPIYRATLSGSADGEQVRLEAAAMVWQHTGEAWNDVALELSTERPTLGTEPPALEADVLRSREKSVEEKKTVQVQVREQEIQALGGGGAVAELPGVDDGGEVRLLRGKGSPRIPSDGRAHRVPLFDFTAKAQSELVATPEKSPLAQRVARFQNDGPAVLLAGPVDLVRSSGFVGRAQLSFAAKGEEVKLGFGSEDALRLSRLTWEETSEAFITSRRTTKHRVKVYVSNAASAPARLVVEERIPVSEIAEVKVELSTSETKPPPRAISPDGIVRFDLALGAAAKQEIELAYEVGASAKVAGL